MNKASAQRISRNSCLILGLLLIYCFVLISFFESYAMARELWLIQATGYLALGALCLSLLITPSLLVFQWFGIKHSVVVLAAFRRSLGMSAAWLALVHALLSCFTYLYNSWLVILYFPQLRAGFSALIILLILLVTSFPGAIRLLRIRLWKSLHRLVYVVVLLLFQHLIQSPFALRQLVLTVFTVLVVLIASRFLKNTTRVS